MGRIKLPDEWVARRKAMTKSSERNSRSDINDLESLRARAKKLSIYGADRMSREELLYEIGKAEGGDGGFGV